MRDKAKQTAIGGVTAALAVVIMCMGGLIPVATFACPMICMLLLRVYASLGGQRMAWAWYGVVAILSLLLGPDMEAALVFLCLGYYPLIKPGLDKMKISCLWKLVYFNIVIGVTYAIVLRVLGMDRIAQEYADLGTVMNVILLVLGNVTFFLLDLVLGKKIRRKAR